MNGNHTGRMPREATVTPFDPPIPILRRPLPAAEDDNPSKGPFVLAFQDEQSWISAWHSCELKIVERCEAGARMGCSINATKKCKPPWWLNMLPFLKKPNHQQSQNACEEQEMQSCLEVARSKCFSYAKETCEGGLSDIRVICSEPFMNTKQHRYRRSKRSSKEEAVRLADERGPSKQSKE
ncbi:hypothetical protein KP509_07G026200 [Ceratopteris richardii]|uniref:Uncharacterized protein n=1 Tax=Ceratopteris richardii TaxID=49495 RepID=A0A8T2UDC1_CERRI|nr:hypothetical protein KP509_07G026200 [Ceratopteris richardii]KAH7432520.1 hypothetical protein KP509_07G026200 [Ceratopteris richardii]